MEKLPVDNPNSVLCVDCQALLDENRALKDEIQKLRARLEEPEKLKRAISEGDLDALVMPVSEEDLSVFTLADTDSTFHTLAEIANEDIVVVDADFKITYVGKRLLDKTGYSQEEVIGKPWLNFVDKEYKTLVEQKMDKRRQGVGDSYEVKLIHKDGSSYWALLSSKPLFDKDGRFKGALSMLTDITERKHTEESLRVAYEELQAQSEDLQAQSEEIQAQNEELQSQSEELRRAYEILQESESRFQSVLDNSRDVIYRMNVQTGHYEYISPSAEAVTGFTPDELMALDTETSLAMIHPDDLPAMREAMVRLKNTGKGEAEYRQRTKSGDYSWISNNISLIIDSTGKPLYRNGNIRDITKRKQAEISLKKSESSLAEAQRLAHIGSWEWNLKTGNVHWSDELFSIYGVDKHTFIPTISSFADYIHPDDREFVNRMINQIMSGEKSVNFDFRIISADGSMHYLNTIAEVTDFDENGKPLLMEGINQDITERKRLEGTLQRSEKHLSELVSSIQDGFFELDREWRFTYINHRAARNGNFEPEDLIRECIWEKFPYMVNSKLGKMYREVMVTRQPANFEIKSSIMGR